MTNTTRVPFIAAMALVGLCFTSPAPAMPVALVDTGPSPVPHGGYGLSQAQGLAGEFLISVDSVFRVTDVEGWIEGFTAGNVAVSLYGNGPGVPGSLLYREELFVPVQSPNWSGVHDLNWLIGPGAYWVAFEVLAPEDFSGAMANFVPNPLVGEAVRSVQSVWSTNTDLNIGIRVLADDDLSPQFQNPRRPLY